MLRSFVLIAVVVAVLATTTTSTASSSATPAESQTNGSQSFAAFESLSGPYLVTTPTGPDGFPILYSTKQAAEDACYALHQTSKQHNWVILPFWIQSEIRTIDSIAANPQYRHWFAGNHGQIWMTAQQRPARFFGNGTRQTLKTVTPAYAFCLPRCPTGRRMLSGTPALREVYQSGDYSCNDGYRRVSNDPALCVGSFERRWKVHCVPTNSSPHVAVFPALPNIVMTTFLTTDGMPLIYKSPVHAKAECHRLHKIPPLILALQHSVFLANLRQMARNPLYQRWFAGGRGKFWTSSNNAIFIQMHANGTDTTGTVGSAYGFCLALCHTDSARSIQRSLGLKQVFTNGSYTCREGFERVGDAPTYCQDFAWKVNCRYVGPRVAVFPTKGLLMTVEVGSDGFPVKFNTRQEAINSCRARHKPTSLAQWLLPWMDSEIAATLTSAVRQGRYSYWATQDFKVWLHEPDMAIVPASGAPTQTAPRGTAGPAAAFCMAVCPVFELSYTRNTPGLLRVHTNGSYTCQNGFRRASNDPAYCVGERWSAQCERI